MIYTKRTIEEKTGKKWIIDSISTDNDYVSIMLIDELTGKYVIKSNYVRSVKYEYGKIIVTYNNSKTRVIYE